MGAGAEGFQVNHAVLPIVILDTFMNIDWR